MGEDTLPIIIFIVVMAAFMVWYFTSMKKKVGQMPKKVLEKYEGKIKADCKTRYFYCFVTEDMLVFQDDKLTWFEFKMDEIASVYGRRGMHNQCGFGLYGKDDKMLKGEIISCQGHKAKSGFWQVSNEPEAIALRDFVLANVPGVQERA